MVLSLATMLDFHGGLSSSIREQIGTVSEYYLEFMAYANRVHMNDPEILLACFINGLKIHIHREVFFENPKSFFSAFYLAIVYEKRFAEQIKIDHQTQTENQNSSSAISESTISDRKSTIADQDFLDPDVEQHSQIHFHIQHQHLDPTIFCEKSENEMQIQKSETNLDANSNSAITEQGHILDQRVMHSDSEAIHGGVEGASAKRKGEESLSSEDWEKSSTVVKTPLDLVRVILSDLSTVAVVEVEEAEADDVTIVMEAVKRIEVEAISQVEGAASVVIGRIPVAEEANGGVTDSGREEKPRAVVLPRGCVSELQQEREDGGAVAAGKEEMVPVDFLGWGAMEAKLKRRSLDLLVVLSDGAACVKEMQQNALKPQHPRCVLLMGQAHDTNGEIIWFWYKLGYGTNSIQQGKLVKLKCGPSQEPRFEIKGLPDSSSKQWDPGGSLFSL